MTGIGRALRPGEAVVLDTLSGTAVDELRLRLSAPAATPDLVAMLLTEDGKVRNDDDLIFYNNPTSSDDSVQFQAGQGDAQWIRLRLQSLDADIAKVVFGCAGGLLDRAEASELTLTLLDRNSAPLAAATFPADATHRAMILFEVYRRQGHWRCRLLAQGYAGGLAALVTEFGVSVEGEEAPPAPPPTPTPSLPSSAAQPPVTGSAPAIQPPVTGSAPAAQPPVTGSAPASQPPTPTSQPQAPAPEPSAPPSYPHQPPGAGPQPDGSPSASVPPVPASDPQWTPSADTARRGGLFTSRKRQQLEAENDELKRLLATSGALDNAAIASERQRLTTEVAALAAEAQRRRADLTGLEQRLHQVRAAIATAEGDAELTDVGIYRYRHRLDDSIAYKGRIDALRDRFKDTAKRGAAVTGNTDWTVNGSLAQGRKMVNEMSKLMLRAYNADADHAVRTMRAYKLDSALTRLDTTRNTIARLGATMNIRISDEYHRLRRQELELTADYLSKVEEEKERQRQMREQQREQQRADAEYAREQERLERDRHKYAEALAQLEARGDTAKAEEIRGRLGSVTDALAGLIERRSNMRLGHVYVISNIGSFGPRMVKIGMTRRLEPMDRIRELGDASVPFRFDVHALIFSEDAIALETALHQRFAAQRVNHVNAHREFFYVTPAEVRGAIADLGSQYLLEYTEDIDAAEWRQSGGPERAVLPT
jgi:stress response protein SCP2